MDVQPIIAPVPTELIKKELNSFEPLLESSHGHFKIYLIRGSEAPSVMLEVGRLREEAYRANGASSGKATDLDDFDTDPSLGFRQLVLWDPELECIAGGYRILHCKDCQFSPDGQPKMPSSHIFHFTDRFLKEFLPDTLELSRSYISIPFQRKAAEIRNIYALDSIFEGIAATVGLTGARYFFGKVTFYPQYPKEAFQLISSFFAKRWTSDLIEPVHPEPIPCSPKIEAILCHNDYREDFRALKLALREKGYNLPPILNTYINLTSSFRYFGSVVNDEFSYSTEMGLLVSSADIVKDRYQMLMNR